MSFAVVGCGAVSQILYKPAFIKLEDQIELVGLVDTNQSNAEMFVSEFPKARYFSEIKEFLDSELPDAAIIALPHKLHAAVAIVCLEKGIHVLCEKPMATTAMDAEAMIQAAEKVGKILYVGYFRRFFRATQAIKRLIDQNILGKVVRFEFIEGENYSWPAASDSFFSYKSSGGGVLIDAGAHAIDLMLWWFGDYESVDYYDDGALTGVESDLMADIIMKSGVKGRLRMSRTTPLANKYRIECEKGWIVWNCDDVNHFEMGTWDGDIPLDVNLLYNQPPVMSLADGRSKSPPGFFDYFAEQLHHFVDCVNGKARPMVGGREGIKSLCFIEDCYKSRKPLTTPWRVLQHEAAFMAPAAKLMRERNFNHIAVIGASGFIGQRLVEYLFHLNGEEFRLQPLVRRLNSAARLQAQGIKLSQADVLDKESVLRACTQVDVLFCSFVGGTEVIMKGLQNVLDAALRSGVKKVVYLSTQMVYGFDPPADLAEAAIPNIKKISWYPYSYDKAQAEKIIETYRKKGLDITVLRPGIVYGPYSAYWTQNLIEMILTGKMFLLDGGEGSCDTIFVDDLVEAMILCAADERARNATFNISDVEITTWLRYVETYCHYLNIADTKIHPIRCDEIKNFFMADRAAKLPAVIREINRHKRALAAIMKTLPLGNELIKVAKALLIGKQSAQKPEKDNVNENLDKELLHLQHGRNFLPSSLIHERLQWKPFYNLDKGIEKSVQWYQSLF
jgi:predicted dehydrogenase/nucleoside-diphosphate-sugar epimerase